MGSMKISQREARRLRKRVGELESLLRSQRMAWSREWPGGIHIWTSEANTDAKMATLRTARRLGRPIVAVADQGSPTIRYYAVNPDKP